MHNNYLLLEEEVLRVVDVLVLAVLHPDVKRLRHSVELVLRGHKNSSREGNWVTAMNFCICCCCCWVVVLMMMMTAILTKGQCHIKTRGHKPWKDKKGYAACTCFLLLCFLV